MKITKTCISTLLLFLPLALLIIGFGQLYLTINTESSVSLIKERSRHNAKIAIRLMESRLNEVVADLMFLANTSNARDIVNNINAPGLLTNYLAFSDRKIFYDQISYVDLTGMSLFTVNYNHGSPRITNRKNLRFLGHDKYFYDTLTLMQGDIYISSFQLKKEEGEVVMPPTPVIRFATGIFDALGNRRGVVILTYSGRALLGLLEQLAGKFDDMMLLLNHEGYYLKGHSDKEEWGFAFREKEDRSFESDHPEVWQAIISTPRGQTRDALGIYTHETLCMDKVIDANTASGAGYAAECWKVLSEVTASTLERERDKLLSDILNVLIPALAVCFLGVVAVCRLRERSKRAEEAIIEQNSAYSRFVPREALEILGSGSLLDIDISSNVQKDLTVLFSDIRSYTKLSESMTASEIHAFLNQYFDRIETPIKENNGFIDIFIGDAVMALFPGTADDALRGAMGMKRALTAFDDQRRQEDDAENVVPLRSGFGLHFGEVTMGTIGSRDRMQTTVIGDTVNLASRIESVTKTFGVDIVLSDSVYDLLEDPTAYSLREIDTVRVKGKQVPVILYESFDLDETEVRAGKSKSLHAFLEGLALYKRGEFEQATKLFEKCQEICPQDTIPPIYIKRCATMLRIPPGKDWAGISTL